MLWDFQKCWLKRWGGGGGRFLRLLLSPGVEESSSFGAEGPAGIWPLSFNGRRKGLAAAGTALLASVFSSSAPGGGTPSGAAPTPGTVPPQQSAGLRGLTRWAHGASQDNNLHARRPSF